MASRLEQSRSITPAREERRLEYAAAIDFGTSNCSLAFAIRGNQPENIDLGQNDGLRVPAALLIKVKEDGHSIDGYENNQGKYIYNIDTGVRAQDKNLRSHEYEKFRYFECFKMQLRNDTEITRQMKISAFLGTSYYLIEVIALIMQDIKICFEKHLATTHYRIQERKLKATDFSWVITVPAIWQDKGKQLMREAAYKAGLLCEVDPITKLTPVTEPLNEPANIRQHVADKLIIALEPECAGLYCHQLTREMLANYCTSCNDIVSNQYMIVDVGGGTVDIAIHDLESTTNTVHSVLPPTGNDWGGTKVNEEFSQLLQKIVGDPNFQLFHSQIGFEAKNKAETNYLIYQSFEKQKIKFQSDSSDEYFIRLPSKFVTFYEEEKIRKKIESLGFDFDEDDNLIISSSQMESLFAPAVQGITNCVNTSFRKSPIQNITTIYLIGGFGGCQYIYAKISEALSTKSPPVNIIVPSQHKLAVSQGAVIFGRNPRIIGSRVSGAYYGLQATKKYDPIVHNYTRRKFSLEHGCFVCYNIFDIFIRKEQIIKVDDTFKKMYTPNKADNTVITFDIYRTSSDKIVYIKDIKGQPLDEIEKIGTVTLLAPLCDLPLDKRIIEVTFSIGSTELKVSAIYLPTGQEVEVSVNFL